MVWAPLLLWTCAHQPAASAELMAILAEKKRQSYASNHPVITQNSLILLVRKGLIAQLHLETNHVLGEQKNPWIHC